jgi:hypothetical protein
MPLPIPKPSAPRRGTENQSIPVCSLFLPRSVAGSVCPPSLLVYLRVAAPGVYRGSEYGRVMRLPATSR